MNDKFPTDPYWTLRPERPTPLDALCECSRVSTLVLCDRLTFNPIVCFICGGEVLPERVGYDAELVDSITIWQALHSSLYRL